MSRNESVEQGNLFDAQIIPLRLAITAMRDSGYKNTSHALAELIDNAIQAKASMIEVLCIEKLDLVKMRERRRLWKIAVLDNGSGMDVKTLRMALQFGNGTRLDDRTGIGRFGMGLPNASISQATRVDVWSWQNGPDNAIKSYIDLAEIGTGDMSEVPRPVHDPIPELWRRLSNHIGQHGTLVLWSDLDFERLTWKRAERALSRTEEIVGRVYRRFIADGTVTIRLLARENGTEDTLIDRETETNDPLYLVASKKLPPPFDTQPMFDHVFDESHDIEYGGSTYTVTVRYSLASTTTITPPGSQDRGQTLYGKHAARNIGVSLLRADREIMLDHGWCVGYDPRERWWGAEVEFSPALDELFGVTNNKQTATHFGELATTEWKELAEEGEEFIDVVSRLKEDGDPRGWLLGLSDSIKRNLDALRKQIKNQGAARRSSRRTRHDVDVATKTVNEGWKERSKEQPLEEDKQSLTKNDLNAIHTDLTEHKNYTNSDASELIALIKDADLKVVFLEQDFPNSSQLFNVEMKGNITEVVFNRNHPSFEDIFGTIATVDEDLGLLPQGEVVERLTRAVNAAKIIFAAWARYEREAGLDRAKALRRVRDDWGQITAKFLQPHDDLSL